MIKNILFVSLLLAGGTHWASAQSQTTVGAAASLPVSKKENMTISQLFQKVEDNSKSLRTSLSGVEAAHLGIEAAKSKKLPDLDASLSFSYIGNALITDRNFSNVHGLKSPHFGNNFAFQAQLVVYAGGAINAGIKLAELGKQQAEVGVKLTRQQIRFIALGQYLDLYKIDNRIKVYEKNIELTRQLIDDIKEKQTHGMALKNDITRYELQMESLKLGLTALRNNRSILNHQLCNILGMNLGYLKKEGSQMNQTSQEIQIIPDATIADKTYGKEGEAYWQTAGTLNSPLLEQSNNAIRIAEQKEKIAKSDLLPKVAFVAADNFDGPILFELPPVEKNLNVWYVGVGVKYSLSSLFKSNKRIKQAAVETRQAKEAHAVQAEQLNNNVQAAYVQYQQTYVELETQRKSVELAQQNYDVMNARYLGAKARYEQASSRKASAASVRNVQTQQLGGSRAGESVAEAQLNLARLNLSYTVIVATCDGVMGRKDIHEGQLVQPGQMLARIVDDNDVWVVANYRETQMDGITVGKSVDFTADAIPGVVFHGKVEALSAAAGNAYSMIPVDNATGNFVKVEQRVPVRIALTKDNDPKQIALLRAGLNVETKVRIK